MDIKTLEYMSDRVEKAKAIVKQIEKLKANIDSMHLVKEVRFINSNWNAQFDSTIGGLTAELKEAYTQAAKNKIDHLERKLAEL